MADTRCLEVVENLPWLANGTLSGAEKARVESHLAECAACRNEAERCRLERVAMRAEGLTAPSPHPAQLERLLARLDRAEPDESAAPGGPALVALARRTPRVVRYALAAQLVVLAGLGYLAARIETAPPAPAPAFRALSDAPATARGDLRVVFDPAATEAEIRALLLSAGASIAAGPSPAGIYTLSIAPAGTGPSLEAALALLRADPRVRLAEPVAEVASSDAAVR
jgi:hypothetical protein